MRTVALLVLLWLAVLGAAVADAPVPDVHRELVNTTIELRLLRGEMADVEAENLKLKLMLNHIVNNKLACI